MAAKGIRKSKDEENTAGVISATMAEACLQKSGGGVRDHGRVAGCSVRKPISNASAKRPLCTRQGFAESSSRFPRTRAELN